MRRVLIVCLGAVLASCGKPPTPAAPSAVAAPEVVAATPETGGSLLEAFRVSYDGPAPLVITGDSGEQLTMTPQAFVNVQPGVVALISKGETPEGGCHACYGTISIRYLRPEGKSFVVLSKWDGVGGGAPYGQVAPWSIRIDIDNYPVMVFTKDDGGQGCFDRRADLVSLTPTGPRSIATDIVLDARYEPGPEESPGKAWKVEGKIVPIERGKRFAVHRTGLRTTPVVYRRVGDVFRTSDDRDVPSC